MDVSEGGDDEAVTSSMVDDVFFIVQKAVRWESTIFKSWVENVRVSYGTLQWTSNLHVVDCGLT